MIKEKKDKQIRERGREQTRKNKGSDKDKK